MLAVSVVILALLTVFMLRIGRTMLFPPALYCASWLVTLTGVLAADTRLLPISEYVCLIYLVGAIAFSLGGVTSLLLFDSRLKAPSISGRTPKITRIVLDVSLLLLIALYPYFLSKVQQIAGTTNPLLILAVIRAKTVLTNKNPLGFAGNLVVVSGLVANAMVYELDGSWNRRVRTVISVIVALSYNVLTGSKGGALLLVTLFFLTQVRNRGIKVSAALLSSLPVVAFFAAGLLAINLSGKSLRSTTTVARYVGAEISNYWLGSPVAFSRVAEKPDSLRSTENIDRFFLNTANSLGFKNRIPNINARYTTVGPEGQDTNTYTIYFSYFKSYGWFGTITLLSGLAAILTFTWNLAMRGAPVSTLLYASLCTAIVQSMYSENFFLGLNGYIKAIVIYGLLYWALPRFFPDATPDRGANCGAEPKKNLITTAAMRTDSA